MSNSTSEPGYIKSFIKSYFGAAVAIFLTIITYFLFFGSTGVEVKNLSNTEYANHIKKEPSGKKLFVLEYYGGVNLISTEVFSSKIDTVHALAKEGDEVLIDMTSPGGATIGCSHSWDMVNSLSSKGIKVIGVVDMMAASCGYKIISAADEIYAGSGAMVGNIGTVMTKRKEGVSCLSGKCMYTGNTITIGSSRLKELLGGAPIRTESDVNLIRDSFITPSYEKFVNYVLHKRKDKIAKEDYNKVFSGNAFVGSEALELGLIDGINYSHFIKGDKDRQGYEVILVDYAFSFSEMAGMLATGNISMLSEQLFGISESSFATDTAQLIE